MKDSKQILEELDGIRSEITALEADLDKEATEERTTKYQELIAREKAKESELEAAKIKEERAAKAAKEKAEKEARAAGSGIQRESKEEREAKEKYSIARALRIAYGYEKNDGLEGEMSQEGRKQHERMGISVSAHGIVIPRDMLEPTAEKRAAITENTTTGIDLGSFEQAVYANTVLGNLGIQRLSTTEDTRIPILPAFTTQWEGETDAATDGGSALSKVDLTPKRLASYVDFSLQASMQHNQSLEQQIRAGLAEAIGAKVEYSVFTDDTSNGGPTHIYSGKTALDTATITATAFGLIEEVIGNNYFKGSLGFIFDNGLYSEVYQAVQATGVSPLVVNERIQSMPFYFSTQMAQISSNDVAYFGNWSKFYVAQFGGLDIMLDPYTQRVSGKNRLVVNTFWDHALAQGAAISVARYNPA